MTTILVVEDNPAHLRLAVAILSRAGYEVLQAGDAASAMRQAHEYQPALILTDINLPDRSGLDLVRELKNDPITRAISVLVVSAYLGDHPHRDAHAVGCAGFIAKPYHYGELLATVASVLDKN